MSLSLTQSDIKCSATVRAPVNWTYFASSARAQIPAARGADAEVPVWSSVHWLCMSVVSCSNHVTQSQQSPIHGCSQGTRTQNIFFILFGRKFVTVSQLTTNFIHHQQLLTNKIKQ